MAVRAKFQVGAVTPGKTNAFQGMKDGQPVYNEVDVASITLYAVTGGSPENEDFFASTPAGTVQLNIVNQAAADYFEAGQEYYLDFTKVEKPTNNDEAKE